MGPSGLAFHPLLWHVERLCKEWDGDSGTGQSQPGGVGMLRTAPSIPQGSVTGREWHAHFRIFYTICNTSVPPEIAFGAGT